MKTTRILLGLAMLCGAALSVPAQTITTTPTNGPTTITIHARTTDGKLPVDVSCTVVQPVGQIVSGPLPQPLSLVGKSGDWTATNVPARFYGVGLRSSNYVDTFSSQLLRVEAGTNYSIDFVLSRGATFKGRVLDDATGKPIEHFFVYGETSHSYDVRTDAEGRYELPRVSGALEIQIWPRTNYVGQRIKMDAAAEDRTVSVPDIRLKHGGWISGRVERPADMVSNATAEVRLEIQGGLPTNSMVDDVSARNEGTFHTSALPPGTYTLHAEWHLPFTKGGPPQTWRANGSVSNINVIVGCETTNVVIPTKMAIPATDRSGR